METSLWMIDWNDQMGMGVPAIDAADQRLFANVNAFNRAIVEGEPDEAVHDMFDKMVRESLSHFRYEEQFLSKVGYPLPDGHAALHRQISAELEYVKQDLNRTKSRRTWAECGLLVKQLFVEHTLREARIYRSLPRAGAN